MKKVVDIRGGIKGHILRRLVHLFNFFIPLIYYFYGVKLASLVKLNVHQLLAIIIILIFVFEILRLMNGWTIFGQRDYEAKSISAFAWGALAIGIVLYFAPGMQYGTPIIWSYALGDPLLGELRRSQISRWIVFMMGMSFFTLIWLVCTLLFQTPWWWAPIMGVVITAAEWPSLKWIDDNALMQLVPLIIILLQYHFLGNFL